MRGTTDGPKQSAALAERHQEKKGYKDQKVKTGLLFKATEATAEETTGSPNNAFDVITARGAPEQAPMPLRIIIRSGETEEDLFRVCEEAAMAEISSDSDFNSPGGSFGSATEIGPSGLPSQKQLMWILRAVILLLVMLAAIVFYAKMPGA